MTKYNDLLRQLEDARDELLARIEQLPQNENIEMISDSPKAMTVKFSDLGNRWDTRYHDFTKQYEMITTHLTLIPLELVEKRFQLIIESGVVPYQGERFKLNPKVIELLKTVELV